MQIRVMALKVVDNSIRRRHDLQGHFEVSLNRNGGSVKRYHNWSPLD